jgi:CDGSH-type Zn-finger protein/uncharacterized Fe-S cluster protein YjdI
VNTHEPRIRVENREELLFLLSEASSIEHNLMCCYLYAAWSLKRGVEDGLTPEEAVAVRRWKRMITSIAVEEMVHLALASNLSVALGGAPFLSRPNFPIPPGFHPSGVVATLAPFCHAVLDHFIFLERPEGDLAEDSADFAHPSFPARRQVKGRLMPSHQDYLTVGHLYRGIRRGFGNLHHHLGHAGLFTGDAALQIGPEDVSLPGIMTVTDLASADRAIDTIIDQGEGAPGHRDDSHYQRFLAVRREFEELSKKNPSFAPAFPVARNPVMRRPLVQDDRILIDDPEAAPVLDLANALYNHMLRCLAQSYGRGADETATKQLYLGIAIDVMQALTPIAEHLASLPASRSHPGVNAGMTFTILRDIARVPRGAPEARMISERLTEMSEHAAMLFPEGHALASIAGVLSAAAARIELPKANGRKAHAAHPANRAAEPVPPPAEKVAPPTGLHHDLPSGSASLGGTETVEGKDIIVHFQGRRCIHARFCVLHTPTVFKANTPGDWIFPDTCSADAIVRVAHNCPSGAITYTPKGDLPAEAAPPVNTLNIRENGPYAIRAPMTLDGEPIGFRATFCRCGESKHKPFCDNSHIAAGFKATGEPEAREAAPLAARNGPLAIEPQKNGPLQIVGNLEILSGTGRAIDRVTRARLCRCGYSSTKPFCDNTHLKVGFKTD